jgi:cholesterol transport system auxiliary component
MMRAARMLAGSLVLLPALLLPGCGGLLESRLASPQSYVLRLPPPAAQPGDTPLGSVLVQRPETGPGLHTDRIALVRDGGRFDFYEAARWAAPTPDLLESALVDALRATGRYSAVMDDASPFAPRYDLRVSLRRFEADYSSGDANPVIHVVMDCTLGRRRDRQLLASFTAQGSARADANRLGAVIAAFESASATAVARLLDATHEAVSSDSRAAQSEGR